MGVKLLHDQKATRAHRDAIH